MIAGDGVTESLILERNVQVSAAMIKKHLLTLSLVILALTTNKIYANNGTNSGASKICQILLSGAENQRQARLFTIGASQIQRVDSVLKLLTDSQRAELYETLKSTDFRSLALSMKAGHVNGLQRLIETQPDLSTILVDFIEFGEAFPGIFATQNVDQAVRKVVDLVKQQETANKLGNHDILFAQSEAPRLRRAIGNMIINLITQANAEYDGMSFGRTPTQNFFYRLKRFFLPTYSRVRELVGTAQALEQQLFRLRAVDKLVIEEGLSEALQLGLSDAQLQDLLKLVTNSPGELKEITSIVKRIFGDKFELGAGIEIGSFDIYGAYNRLDEMDFAKVQDVFDKLNIGSLDSLDRILDEARVRQGKPARSENEYSALEIQIRFEAAFRQSHRAHEIYRGFTSQTANESYRVERLRSRQVADGKDERGNTKFKTEWYYEDDTVYPSFENILSGSYDTGSRFVRGLEDIKTRASKMANREQQPRRLAAKVYEYVSYLTHDWYAKAVASGGKETTGSGVRNFKFETEHYISLVEAEIKRQTEYYNWSDEQILNQYSEDNIKNFKGRNRWMLEKLHQSRSELKMLEVALDKGLPEIYPFYDLFSYSAWMDGLRRHRNRAWTLQGAAAAGVIGGGVAVGVNPDAQQYLLQQGLEIQQFIQMGIQHIRNTLSQMR